MQSLLLLCLQSLKALGRGQLMVPSFTSSCQSSGSFNILTYIVAYPLFMPLMLLLLDRYCPLDRIAHVDSYT